MTYYNAFWHIFKPNQKNSFFCHPLLKSYNKEEELTKRSKATIILEIP